MLINYDYVKESVIFSQDSFDIDGDTCTINYIPATEINSDGLCLYSGKFGHYPNKFFINHFIHLVNNAFKTCKFVKFVVSTESKRNNSIFDSSIKILNRYKLRKYFYFDFTYKHLNKKFAEITLFKNSYPYPILLSDRCKIIIGKVENNFGYIGVLPKLEVNQFGYFVDHGKILTFPCTKFVRWVMELVIMNVDNFGSMYFILPNKTDRNHSIAESAIRIVSKIIKRYELDLIYDTTHIGDDVKLTITSRVCKNIIEFPTVCVYDMLYQQIHGTPYPYVEIEKKL